MQIWNASPEEKTIFWHSIKHTWINGTDFPQKYASPLDIDGYGKGYFCTTAFNESHAIVLGWISNRVYQAKLVNIKTNHWTYWPSLPLKDGDSGLLHRCQTTVGYSSKDKRFRKTQ